ncbi:MAG: PrsW family glutamic-type intramembrane protease, partial [Chloroflexota bacterium]
FYFSILTPLIEEPVKSIGVWLGADRLRTPAQGFALGALCGAGFAVVESMFATFSPDQSWGVTFLTRSASGLMHITASGLIGWGVARARLSRRHLPLIGAYALGIAIHGLWNGAAISIVAGGMRIALNAVTREIDFFGIFMALGGMGLLFVMTVAIVVFLPVFNHRLRKRASDEASRARDAAAV